MDILEPIDNFYLGIIAGGKSKRFGSNKSLYKYNGLSPISKIIYEIPKFLRIPEAIFISIHNKEQYEVIFPIIQEEINQKEDFSLKIPKTDLNPSITFMDRKSRTNHTEITIPLIFVYDSKPIIERGIRAPILGLQAIFNKLRRGFVQIIPCDTPFFDSVIINEYLLKIKSVNYHFDALIPRWKNGYIEGLNAIYRAEIFLRIVEENIANQKYKLRCLLDSNLCKRPIIFYNIEEKLNKRDPNYKTFKNINTIKDLYIIG